jgi:hypothetical protein
MSFVFGFGFVSLSVGSHATLTHSCLTTNSRLSPRRRRLVSATRRAIVHASANHIDLTAGTAVGPFCVFAVLRAASPSYSSTMSSTRSATLPHGNSGTSAHRRAHRVQSTTVTVQHIVIIDPIRHRLAVSSWPYMTFLLAARAEPPRTSLPCPTSVQRARTTPRHERRRCLVLSCEERVVREAAITTKSVPLGQQPDERCRYAATTR